MTTLNEVSDNPPNPSVVYARQRFMTHCPNCGMRTIFHYAGVQKWSVDVARKTHQPTSVSLWNCSHCGSTFTRQTLAKAKK